MTDLAALLCEQAGIVSRDQLRACGVSRGEERAELDGGRWRALSDTAVCTHNGPLTGVQMAWALVLSAQPPAALCGLTALTWWGVLGFKSDEVHIVVRRGAKVLRVAGVTAAVHESRRFEATDVSVLTPPVTSLERAAVDAAVWSHDVRTACRIAVAAVQQRRTTPDKLLAELDAAGRVRYNRVLRTLLCDLEAGAEALSEVAFLRWCRQHGFPKPRLQVRLDGRRRRRYLDAVFVLPGGRRVLVEIDGGVHLTLESRWRDTAKDNDAALAGELTLRFPSVAIYTNDPNAVAQLRAALEVVRR